MKQGSGSKGGERTFSAKVSKAVLQLVSYQAGLELRHSQGQYYRNITNIYYL